MSFVLSITVTKTHDESNFIKEKFLWAHSFMKYSLAWLECVVATLAWDMMKEAYRVLFHLSTDEEAKNLGHNQK